VRVNFEGVMPATHVVLRLRTDDGLEGISYVSRVTAQNGRPLCQLIFRIEDPVSSHDFEGPAHISRTIVQPTCAGEVFQHPHEFRRLLEGRCCDYVMLDQDLGLTGFAKVAHMAEIHGCAVVNHLAPEVLAHGVAAAPNGLIVGLVPWGQPLFTEPLRIEAGEIVMPRGPGLGLTLDEDVLRTCAVD
jgi:mandelate racemase